MQAEYKTNVDLRVLVWRDDEAGVFVSYCPSLNIHAQGETEAEARDAMHGAILLFDRSVKRLGTRTGINNQSNKTR